MGRSQQQNSLPGLGTWRLGGRDVRPDRVVCWAGSRSPSLLESLLASLDEVLGSGALARRLGDIAGMGSRGRVHPGKTPRPRHKIRRVGKVLSIGPLREG